VESAPLEPLLLALLVGLSLPRLRWPSRLVMGGMMKIGFVPGGRASGRSAELIFYAGGEDQAHDCFF
jgi:hypothetical protein